MKFSRLHTLGLGTNSLRRIPVTTLEALGVLKTVTGHNRSDETSTQMDGLQAENTRLRIEIATLRAENDGLKKLLEEREKVVALLEAKPSRKPWWSRWKSS